MRLTTTPDTTNTGSIWYNTTTNRLEYSYFAASWSTGGALITARFGLAGAGTQNAGLAFGGRDCNYSSVSCTEEYNKGIQICTL